MTSRPDADSAARAPGWKAYRRGLWSGLDQSSVMGLELLAGILTWSGLGWLADRWLGTGPWLLGIGAVVGFAGGLYLVWLRSGRMEGIGATRDADSGGTTGRSSHV